MQIVAALSTDGKYLGTAGKGSIEDASLFYVTGNPLQKIAFDAYRNQKIVMVVVVPVPKTDGHLTLMTVNDKPLAFMQIHDEIHVFDDDEPEFDDERVVWLEERHYNRFKEDYGLDVPDATAKNYSLRLAGYLTDEDKALWQALWQ